MTKNNKPTDKDVHEATLRGLRKGARPDSETSDEQASDGQRRISHGKVGQKQPVNASLTSFNEFDNKKIVTKRIYRRAGTNELPFPELDPASEKNRTTVKIAARVDGDSAEIFERAATLLGGRGGKRMAMERAMELLADDLGIDLDQEFDPDDHSL